MTYINVWAAEGSINEVFPSFLQVLATLKQQIEHLAASRADFPEMITAAQHWLLARETTFIAAGNGGI